MARDLFIGRTVKDTIFVTGGRMTITAGWGEIDREGEEIVGYLPEEDEGDDK